MTENEAKAWAALEATYRECVRVAGNVWANRLEGAAEDQQACAEMMRDRQTAGPIVAKLVQMIDAPIPVPLFTPRDRLQFLKEVSVTLLIEASKRGLSVTEPEDVGPPVKPFGKDKGTPLDKMSGLDLQSALEWANERPDRAAKYADFMAAVENELAQRAAQTDAIATQPLDEKPLALQTEDRPI